MVRTKMFANNFLDIFSDILFASNHSKYGFLNIIVSLVKEILTHGHKIRYIPSPK